MEKSFDGQASGNSFDRQTIGCSFDRQSSGNSFDRQSSGNSFDRQASGNSFDRQASGSSFDRQTIGCSFDRHSSFDRQSTLALEGTGADSLSVPAAAAAAAVDEEPPFFVFLPTDFQEGPPLLPPTPIVTTGTGRTAMDGTRKQQMQATSPTTYLGSEAIPPLKIPQFDEQNQMTMKDLRVTPSTASASSDTQRSFYLNSPSVTVGANANQQLTDFHRSAHSPGGTGPATGRNYMFSPQGSTMRSTHNSNYTVTDSQSYSQRSYFSSEAQSQSPHTHDDSSCGYPNNLLSTISSYSHDTQRSNTVLGMTQLAISSHQELMGINKSSDQLYMNNQYSGYINTTTTSAAAAPTDPLFFLDDNEDNSPRLESEQQARCPSSTVYMNNDVNYLEMEGATTRLSKVSEGMECCSDNDDLFSTSSQKGLFLSIFESSTNSARKPQDRALFMTENDDDNDEEEELVDVTRSSSKLSVVSTLSNPAHNYGLERCSFASTTKSVTFNHTTTMLEESGRHGHEQVISEKFESLSLKHNDAMSLRPISYGSTGNSSVSTKKSYQSLSSKILSNVNAFFNKLIPSSSSADTSSAAAKPEIKSTKDTSVRGSDLIDHMHVHGHGHSHRDGHGPSDEDSCHSVHVDRRRSRSMTSNLSHRLSAPHRGDVDATAMKHLSNSSTDQLNQSTGTGAGSSKIYPSTKRLRRIKDKIKSTLGLSDSSRQQMSDDIDGAPYSNYSSPRNSYSESRLSFSSQKR